MTRKRNRTSCIDAYREQVIFWHLRGYKQEWIAAELNRLYNVTINRSSHLKMAKKTQRTFAKPANQAKPDTERPVKSQRGSDQALFHRNPPEL